MSERISALQDGRNISHENPRPVLQIRISVLNDTISGYRLHIDLHYTYLCKRLILVASQESDLGMALYDD